LLQLLCGTLGPTTGTVRVDGRISALLELGAGFNSEFSGRDNLLLNGPLLGLTREELLHRLDDIIDFSGIRPFIDQPVKTYSSGMFVRLAFSLATSVDPEILVVDEALSVGDGEFARRSFDRILEMKRRGVTILFCSHALYQVEAFCSRVLWLHEGKVRGLGPSGEVIRQYQLFLSGAGEGAHSSTDASLPSVATPGHARISRLSVGVDGNWGNELEVVPGVSTLTVVIEFESDPAMPAPTAAVSIDLPIQLSLTCCVARSDGVALERDASGRGRATLQWPKLALRKGTYHVGVYLGSEDAIHVYETSLALATLRVSDPLPEPGFVQLPHHWEMQAGHAEEELSPQKQEAV
jgi:lipopolysaccharide transport system ATP-binding protein